MSRVGQKIKMTSLDELLCVPTIEGTNDIEIAIFYAYPIEEDYITKYVDPLVKEYKVNLVFTAHSHLWNRFKMDSVNILQSSNVANTYNAFYGESGERELAPSAFSANDLYYQYREHWDKKNYVMKGDPGGLEPVKPSIASLPDDNPYLASNTITAFSVLDTGRGVVESYYSIKSNGDLLYKQITILYLISI